MRQRKILTCGVSVLALQMAGCVTPTQAPYFDPRVLQRAERSQARYDQYSSLKPLPTMQEDPLGGPGDIDAGTTRPSDMLEGPTTGPMIGDEQEPVLRLTLQQAIQRAVLYNHDVKVAGYQPAIDASRVTEAAAFFDPVFFTTVQFQKKDDETAGEVFTAPAGSSTTNITTFFDRQDVYTGQMGIKGNLESGGQIQASYNTTYNLLIPKRFVDNPFYQNELELQLTQPLLRNFGSDVNEAKIFISRNNARVSLMEFRKALEENVAKVEEAYWQLVQAQRNVEVEEKVLKENESSYRLQYNRLKQKLITSLEVSQVQTSLDARRATLIRAKADARNISDELKQLMNDPNLPVSSSVVIVPADDPVVTPMRFDIADQINSGLENRFELGEELLKIDTASVTYNLARNNTLPKLDFVGSVTPNVTDGDYSSAIANQVRFGHYEYSLGLNFEFPIGNREALAILRRTALQRQQEIETYSSLIAQVALDVRTSAREVETDYLLILSNQQSRMAAQLALDDVVERQEKGTESLTPEFVQLRLDLADKVAEQQESENQAVANYNIALERLERAKGTLLKYNNIVMQEEPYQDQGMLR
jgi:outer membrane protein